MNTLVDTPQKAALSGADIVVEMASGLSFTFPCAAYPRLAEASDEARAVIEVSPFGLHWPELDEDLSIAALKTAHAIGG